MIIKKGEPGYTLHIFGVLGLVLAPVLLLYAWLSQGNLDDFRQTGTAVMARVTGKSRSKLPMTRLIKSPTEYRVRVSFWTAPLLRGGKLITAEVRDHVRPAVWQELKSGDSVEVVFLPDTPQRAILKSSLESRSAPPAERFAFGLAILFLGVGLLIFPGSGRGAK